MNYRKTLGPALLTAICVFALIGLINSVATQDDAITEVAQQQELVTICHKPGTPAQKTMTLPMNAVGNEDDAKKHLGHGDSVGPCEEESTPTPTPFTPPPTPQVSHTNTPAPTVAPTNTPVNTPTNTPPPINTPVPTEVIITHILTPTRIFTPSATFRLPPPGDTCDLCTAQESALQADARLKNTIADVLEELFFNNLVPDFIKEIFDNE